MGPRQLLIAACLLGCGPLPAEPGARLTDAPPHDGAVSEPRAWLPRLVEFQVECAETRGVLLCNDDERFSVAAPHFLLALPGADADGAPGTPLISVDEGPSLCRGTCAIRDSEYRVASGNAHEAGPGEIIEDGWRSLFGEFVRPEPALRPMPEVWGDWLYAQSVLADARALLRRAEQLRRWSDERWTHDPELTPAVPLPDEPDAVRREPIDVVRFLIGSLLQMRDTASDFRTGHGIRALTHPHVRLSPLLLAMVATDSGVAAETSARLEELASDPALDRYNRARAGMALVHLRALGPRLLGERAAGCSAPDALADDYNPASVQAQGLALAESPPAD